MKKRKVIFKVRAPGAQSVNLAGDFNAWNLSSHPMEKSDEGIWELGLMLAPGRYEYKLVVDGHWWEGIGGAKSLRNPFGTLNRVLIVPEKQVPGQKTAPPRR